ncbi:MAG: hypothetical protein WDN69_05815 [Aliidongia sp.]
MRDIGRALCAAAFGHDPGLPTRSVPGPFHDAQVAAITEGRPFSQLLQVEYRLALPLVAIGAPVGGYYPQVAERLQAELVIPDHAARHQRNRRGRRGGHAIGRDPGDRAQARTLPAARAGREP